MRVIAIKTLRMFWARHPDSQQPLLAWYDEVSGIWSVGTEPAGEEIEFVQQRKRGDAAENQRDDEDADERANFSQQSAGLRGWTRVHDHAPDRFTSRRYFAAAGAGAGSGNGGFFHAPGVTAERFAVTSAFASPSAQRMPPVRMSWKIGFAHTSSRWPMLV